MENEFVPIKKGEDEAYTNKMELELGPKTLMGFLMQTHLEEIHVLRSQSLEMTVVLSTDNSLPEHGWHHVRVHSLGKEIPTEIEVEADNV